MKPNVQWELGQWQLGQWQLCNKWKIYLYITMVYLGIFSIKL